MAYEQGRIHVLYVCDVSLVMQTVGVDAGRMFAVIKESIWI